MNIKLTPTFRNALVKAFTRGMDNDAVATFIVKLAPFYTASELAVLRSRLANANLTYEHNRRILQNPRYAPDNSTYGAECYSRGCGRRRIAKTGWAK